MRLDHALIRVRLLVEALVFALTHPPHLHLLSHRTAVRKAVLLWHWRRMDRRAQRRARRSIARTRARYPWALGLEASIASPHGVGKDGQLAYDLDTRTWYGTLVGNLRAAGSPFFDPTNPIYGPSGGAKGDGITNDILAFRAASTAAQAANGTLFIPPPPGGVAYLLAVTGAETELLLIRHSMQIVGVGWGSELRVATGTGAGIDVIRVAPQTVLFAPDVTMHKFENFRITAQSGTPARHGINFDATVANAFIREFVVQQLWIDPLGGRSIVTTNPIPNANGAIFVCVIARCPSLANGILLSQAGDSITIEDNQIYGANAGVDAQLVAGAGMLVLERNNITSTGGVIIRAGLSVRLVDNEVELAAAYTGANAALVDMAGTPAVTSLQSCEVRGNVITVLAGGGAIDALRVDTAFDTGIDYNHLTVQAGQQHIRVTANATRTRIGRHNVYIGAGGAFVAAAIANAGVMTTQQSDPLLYTQVTDSAAVANTLVETPFNRTFSIPGNTLRAGDVLRIRASGIYSTAGVAPNLTLRIRIGALGTNATTIAALAGQVNNAWRIEADTIIRTVGAAGTLEGGGGFVSILTASGAGVPTNTVSDTTGALVVDVTATWSIANVGNTITMQTLSLELMRAGSTS